MASPHILILGAGRQSVAAGFDLARSISGLRLTLADRDLAQARMAASRILELAPGAEVEAIELAADDTTYKTYKSYTPYLAPDLVLAGVPYFLNPAVHVFAREMGVPSVDLGSDLPDLEAALGPRGGTHSTTAVFDSGVAPGLGNQLARHLVELLENPVGVKILCGGLPLEPRTPLKYRPRFSVEGLIGEYTDPATALVNGQVVELESLTDVERVEIPELGSFEAFVTSGGSSIGPQLFAGKLITYTYKTLRFLGHAATMAAYRDLGLWREENFPEFVRLFEEATSAEDPRDQILLVVEAWSESERKRIWLRHPFDEATGLAAMEQLTGFSASIVAQRVLEGSLTPGLFAAEEVVSGGKMIEELGARGIVFKGSQ
ncbi:MAG TPA: saccharopine dehydrogenase C-terminal domain-containing protein [Fimbriimonadaceae bacterium]|nr:saccharopine dehydrogenase C-terminal domain-containing protein [Fimbriimonadaceae bacterium]